MKYFTSELWCMNNSELAQEREAGGLRWDESSRLYAEYFKTIQGQLSKRFFSMYMKYHGFHDAPMVSIQIINHPRNKQCIIFTLELSDNLYKITYYDVVSYQFHVPDKEGWMRHVMLWGYDEFELLENGYWEHRVLCEMDCEFQIVFKRIGIQKSR